FDLLRPVNAGGVREIADECILQGIAAALPHQIRWRTDGEYFAGVHQRNAIASLRLVHEMRRQKDRDTFVAREIDHRSPKCVAGNGIDTRGRLTENENGGLVQYCD